MLSLNVQGLGNKTKKEWVKELNNKHGVDFLALLETKMNCISYLDVKFMWGNSNFHFVASDSVGNAGGILCVWEETIFKKENVSMSDNFIAIYGTWLPTSTNILIVAIYAPQSPVLKRTLWEYISGLINRWNGETVVLGDFNEVRSEEERFGSIFNQSCARNFNCFISTSGLVDVKMEGFSFTWVHPSAKKISKLDCFLVSDGIILGSPLLRLFALTVIRRTIVLSFLMRSIRILVLLRFVPFILGSLVRVLMLWWNRPEAHLLTMILIVGSKNSILKTLGDINKALDNGSVSDELLVKRIELLNKYHELKQLDMDAKLVTDFRPISLIGSVYKVVTKILANRLTTVISDLVSNTQSAFVAKHQILDGPFILNEVLSWCKRERKQALVFKVDFAKAYDSVRWDFLIDIIHAFGFGSRWCMWIRGIFSSNMASIMVNGSPTAEFPMCCGLKQGDPLAPLLFIIVMETLHISVSRAVNEGIFRGLHIRGSVILSLLFYVDDVVFIGEWSDYNLDNMLRIFNCFYLALGLRINVSKSQVLGIGVPSDIVQQGASRIGCDIMKMPFKYLGVMVGDNMSRLSTWSNSIQKIRAKLSKWNVKTLSIGDRLTLLKSVLGDIPLYNMLIFKAPLSVLHEMEMLRNNIFIGGDAQGKKITWIAWDNVLSSKNNGGLGISSFYALNRALFLKWVWRFLSHDGSLWSQIIRAIHENNIDASVAVKQGAPSLDASFRRLVRDGVERSQWEDLVSLMGGISLFVSADRWVCDLTGDGEFCVIDIRTTLDNRFLPSSVVATRWVKHVSIKVNIFAWRARL
nr:RNA-directed DNA polymerase, eukaryota [Tanacetum cinerariifolium]